MLRRFCGASFRFACDSDVLDASSKDVEHRAVLTFDGSLIVSLPLGSWCSDCVAVRYLVDEIGADLDLTADIAPGADHTDGVDKSVLNL